MIHSRPFSTLPIAVVFAIIGVASVAMASDHEDQSGGFRYGPQGQVFGSPQNSTASKAYGLSNSTPKRIHERARKPAAHGQVFGSPPNSAARAYGLANPTPRQVRGSDRDSAAPYTAAHATAVLDTLAEQHKDKNWDHRYQSWCDVDPNCNGWNKKMQDYEAIEERMPHP